MRLAERLASGELKDLDAIDPLLDDSADFHHLKPRLAEPRLVRLPLALGSPEVATLVRQLLSSERA